MQLRGCTAKGFAFDRRFGVDQTSDEIYDNCVAGLVENLFKVRACLRLRTALSRHQEDHAAMESHHGRSGCAMNAWQAPCGRTSTARPCWRTWHMRCAVCRRLHAMPHCMHA
jgi:hypothetical protein